MKQLKLGLLAASMLFAAPAFADEAKPLNLNEFTRVVQRKSAGEVLQCSIRVYSPPPRTKMGAKMLGPMAGMLRSNKPLPTPPKIVLVSMIHLGEKSFYTQAKAELDSCDLVLFEDGQGNRAMAGMTGELIAGATGLAFQGKEIPIDGKRWRSADLNQAQLFRMMGIHPEALEKMKNMMKGMGRMKISPSMLKNNPQLQAMLPTREKIIAQMRNGSAGDLGGGKMADLILHQRNAIVIGEMTRASHEVRKRVGVIYGAAHMPAVDAFLRGRLGYTLDKVTWLDAVYADPKAAAKAPKPTVEAPKKVEPKKVQPKVAPKKGDDWF
jgi:hypothetical protein